MLLFYCDFFMSGGMNQGGPIVETESLGARPSPTFISKVRQSA